MFKQMLSTVVAAGMLCATPNLSIAQSIHQPESGAKSTIRYNYHRIAVGGGGFITGVLFHPRVRGLLYVRTDIGGAYRWDTREKLWHPLLDWVSMEDANLLGVESIAVDPARPDDLYVAAGTYTHPGTPNGAILISHDRGRNFTIVRLPFQLGGNESARFAGERLAVDPAQPGTVYLGTRNDGLWRSRDSGTTWSPVEQFPTKGSKGLGVVFVVAGKDAAGRAVLYVGVAGDSGLYKSTDGGAHWASVDGFPKQLIPYHAVLDRDSSLYLTAGNEPGPNDVTSGAVLRLLPEGEWRDITPQQTSGGEGFGYAGLALDPRTPGTVLVSTLDRWHAGDTIFRTTDSGSHWTSLKEHAVNDASATPFLQSESGKTGFGHWMGTIAIDPFDASHVLYGTGATLWESHDLLKAEAGGTHWYPDTRGMEETAVLSITRPPKQPAVFLGLGDIGCFRSDASNSAAEAAVVNAIRLSNCDDIAFAAAQPNHMAIVGRSWAKPSQGAIHGGFSRDAGLSWNRFPKEPEGSANGGRVALSEDGSGILWMTNAGAYLSHDEGANWRHIASGKMLEAVPFPTKPDQFILLDRADGSLMSMTNGVGDEAPIALGKVTAGAHLFTDSDGLWLYGRQGLSRWADGEFQHVPLVDAAFAFSSGKPGSPGKAPTLFLAGKVEGSSGIFRSTDGARTWTRIDDEAHEFGWITTLAGDPEIFGRVYIGTNGLGTIVGEPRSKR